MSRLMEIERIGEAVCLREEWNFTIPEVIATVFWVMHYGFNYFLFNMAFADLLIAVFNVGTSWTFNLYHDWWYGDICILTSFFGIAPTTVSVFSMMALSWDRCKAVVWPLKKRPLSRRCSLFTIAVIWAMSTATALPFTFAATVNVLYLYNVVTKTASIRHACSAPAHPIFDHLLFLLQYALPLFVLSFTFALIACAFRSTDVAADHNSKRSNHTKAKNKAVKMLGLMVITFMFCWLPYHLYHTFGLNSFMEFKDPNTGKYIYLGIYWVAMSSSAYNPIIYCFSNERFRIGFRYVFRGLPMIKCRHEDYAYSQLFPEKLRSMAINQQLGLKNPKKFHRTYDSIGLPLACNDSGDRRRIRSSCSTSRTPLAAKNDI
ncbi:unnamed protein product [Angiostrongylus costaricensis]|uniref:G_PROTEIN_RECEP_F1_2 domain-containing protein n=1 Tax=Angiostrongylus costaricensis TaxID=334426 RepID=A0A0R3PKG6_ANGCS|nr:unnamed protein product [Angiostrongylus costaricensis]